MNRLLHELRERHVLRIGVAYLAAAFVVIQVADIVVEPLRLPAWTTTLVIVLLGLGFPVALVLAWALELTSEGVRRAPPSTLLDRMSARSQGMLLIGAGVGVLLLGGLGMVALSSGGASETPRSIAVLPLADLSPAGDQRYFSDGLTEELTAALSRVEGLQVASRTAAFQFADGGADLAEVAERLRVTSVLEGSVRRAGDQLRVTVRLVDPATGYELWTRIYERRLDDVFAVQEEIAHEVLKVLELPASDVRLVRPGTDNLVAYDHLLRGNFHLARRTPEEVRRAIEQYELALEADPSSAAALFRQAYAYLVYADWAWQHPDLGGTEVVLRARQLIERGLTLEPTSAEGWLARAYLSVIEDPYAMAGALDAFQRSLQIDSTNAEAWHQYGQSLMVLGRYDEAETAYERALRVEPGRAMTLVPLGAMELFRGNVEGALAWADSAVAVDPANSYARANRARAWLAAGDVARARGEAELAANVGQGHAIPVTTTLAVAAARSREPELARTLLDEMLQLTGPDSLSALDGSYLAMAATAVGDRDLAISLLQRARPRGAWYWFYLQSPLLDELRADARFEHLVTDAAARRAR
jgi:adenylate cyclase